MSKYYNKEICTEIHAIYGGRQSGKTYYELMKLKERIKQLEEENKRLELENEKHKSWVNSLNKDNHKFRDRINKAIEYLEHEQFKRTILGFGRDKYLDAIKNETIKILKGEE